MLVDHQIMELCSESDVVTPFDPELVGTNSLDVRLGPIILLEVDPTLAWGNKLRYIKNGDMLCWEDSIIYATKDEPYYIKPHQWFLAHTLEVFNLPSDIGAIFHLKSTIGRLGFNHSLAGFCDGGWHGSVLTLELTNSTQHTHLPIWYGMPIGQMQFEKLDKMPHKSYAVRGHYNNDFSVTTAKAEAFGS